MSENQEVPHFEAREREIRQTIGRLRQPQRPPFPYETLCNRLKDVVGWLIELPEPQNPQNPPEISYLFVPREGISLEALRQSSVLNNWQIEGKPRAVVIKYSGKDFSERTLREPREEDFKAAIERLLPEGEKSESDKNN